MPPNAATIVETKAVSQTVRRDKGRDKKSKNGTAGAEKQRGTYWNPTSLTWSEKHSDTFEKIWSYVPDILRGTVLTLAISLIGIAMTGDWLVILVHLSRQLGFSEIPATKEEFLSEWTLESMRLQNVGSFWWSSLVVSYALYFGIGGFLHWYFYVRQRKNATEWKCQPDKWLSTELELKELILGSFSLFFSASITGILACYVSNGGGSTIYYKYDEYGWGWFLLQWPVIFVYQDYVTYWMHRMYHTPFMYKHFHKLHHAYKHPTAFSVTALHPVEMMSIQLIAMAPMFLIPVHWVPMYGVALYTYYHGIIDHSGVNFKAHWWQPWQPDAIFHDNHHQYFHVNFGFNIFIWDKIHGTYRRKDRLYTEDTFYGQGKALGEATEAEIQADMAERIAENPKAYRGDKLEYLITKDELKKMM